MYKDFTSNRPSGSNTKEPMVVGGIISGILRSNSPFAQAFRKHLADIKKGGSVCVQ